MICRNNKIIRSLVLSLLVTFTLVACTTVDQPGYKVKISSIDSGNGGNAEENIGVGNSDQNDAFKEIYKYGNQKKINKPKKRRYRSKKGKLSLDFVNIAIEEFISIVFKEMLNSNYIFDSTIKGEVTVQTRGQVSADQLLSIVESVLISRNAVMIVEDDLYKIMPLSKVKNYSLKPELYSAKHMKPGYRSVIIPVNYINPEDLKSILEAVAPKASHLKIDKERKAVVINATEQEITNVVDAIHIFDVDWLKSKSIAVLPVHKTKAATIKNEISKILNSQNKSHNIVMDTIERFNALLVVADKKKEIDFVKNWLKLLDKEAPSEETGLFVYEVQNRKASELSDLLNGIFNESSGSGGGVASAKKDKNKTASKKNITITNKEKSVKKRNNVTGNKKSSGLRIVADETNNSLVILSSRSEYENILSTIKALDVLPLQVLIEVSIIEVTLSDELSYGLEWYFRNNGILDKYSSDTTLDLNAGAGIGAISPGFSFLLSGTGSLVQAVFNTLAAESRLNVISSPSLMALDNHAATIRVGDQQPVQVASAKSSNNDVLTQSIEYKSTGVLLSVTPRVNSGGLVTMEISQEVTDIGGIDDATGQRSFLQRNINTTVAVKDGRSIVLGGLITENKVEAESGIPGAYKWPIIGGLFGKKTNSKIKRELIVIITPKVIYNHQTASDITREYAEKMQLLRSSLQFQ